MRNIVGYTRGMVLSKKMERLFTYFDRAEVSITLESIVFDVNTDEEMQGVVEVFTTFDRFASMVEACKKQIEKDLKFKGFSQFGKTVFDELLCLIRYGIDGRDYSVELDFIDWYVRCLERNGKNRLEDANKLREEIQRIKSEQVNQMRNMRHQILVLGSKCSSYQNKLEALKKENIHLKNQLLSQKYHKFLDKDYDDIIDSLSANLNQLCHRYPDCPEYSAARNYVMDFNDNLEDLLEKIEEELEKIERNPWVEMVELAIEEFPNDAFMNNYDNWVRENGLPDYFHQ